MTFLNIYRLVPYWSYIVPDVGMAKTTSDWDMPSVAAAVPQCAHVDDARGFHYSFYDESRCWLICYRSFGTSFFFCSLLPWPLAKGSHVLLPYILLPT